MTDGHLFNNISHGGTDEDFVLDKDDGGSPTDDSGERESDASVSGDDKEKPAKKDSRKEAAAAASSSSSSSKASKKKSRDEQDDGKKTKKKDPNAPKRAMTVFMYYSQVERENLKKSNPRLSFIEAAKICGEKWKNLSKEEKEPYEAKAKVDKKRYDDEKNGRIV